MTTRLIEHILMQQQVSSLYIAKTASSREFGMCDHVFRALESTAALWWIDRISDPTKYSLISRVCKNWLSGINPKLSNQ
jgi:hypothetical protein